MFKLKHKTTYDSGSEKVDWNVIEEAARRATNVDLNDKGEAWLVDRLKHKTTYDQVLDLLEAENYHRMYGALVELI